MGAQSKCIMSLVAKKWSIKNKGVIFIQKIYFRQNLPDIGGLMIKLCKPFAIQCYTIEKGQINWRSSESLTPKNTTAVPPFIFYQPFNEHYTCIPAPAKNLHIQVRIWIDPNRIIISNKIR